MGVKSSMLPFPESHYGSALNLQIFLLISIQSNLSYSCYNLLGVLFIISSILLNVQVLLSK